jgi:hypothetical protein
MCMATPAQGPPLPEILACIDGLSDWFRRNGLVQEPLASAGRRVEFFELDHERISEREPAATLRDIYIFLLLDALPCIDGRREQLREQTAAFGPSEASPDPGAAAELHFGDDEQVLAEKIRRINAKISHLASSFENAASRQKQRAILKGAESGANLLTLYGIWLSAGECLRHLVERTEIPRAGKRSIPRTSEEWQVCRAELERALAGAGLSAAQIAEALPGGGSASEVYQRRYRARRREVE